MWPWEACQQRTREVPHTAREHYQSEEVIVLYQFEMLEHEHCGYGTWGSMC